MLTDPETTLDSRLTDRAARHNKRLTKIISFAPNRHSLESSSERDNAAHYHDAPSGSPGDPPTNFAAASNLPRFGPGDGPGSGGVHQPRAGDPVASSERGYPIGEFNAMVEMIKSLPVIETEDNFLDLVLNLEAIMPEGSNFGWLLRTPRQYLTSSQMEDSRKAGYTVCSRLGLKIRQIYATPNYTFLVDLFAKLRSKCRDVSRTRIQSMEELYGSTRTTNETLDVYLIRVVKRFRQVYFFPSTTSPSPLAVGLATHMFIGHQKHYSRELAFIAEPFKRNVNKFETIDEVVAWFEAQDDLYDPKSSQSQAEAKTKGQKPQFKDGKKPYGPKKGKGGNKPSEKTGGRAESAGKSK